MSIVINNKTNSVIGPYNGGTTIPAQSSYAIPSNEIPHFAKDVNLLSDTINGIVTVMLGNAEFGTLNAFNILVQLADAATINKIGQVSSDYMNMVGGLDPNNNAASTRITSTGELKISMVGNDGLYRAYVDSLGRVATNANVTFPETIYVKQSLLNGTSKLLNVNGATVNKSFRFTPSTNVYYVEQLAILIEDQGDFLPTNFGALAALTNGIQINVKSKGQLFTLTTLKDNSDVYLTFTESPASQSIAILLQSNRNSYWAGWRLQNRIVLDPAQGDYIEFLVRDDLSGLNSASAYISAWRTLG